MIWERAITGENDMADLTLEIIEAEVKTVAIPLHISQYQAAAE